MQRQLLEFASVSPHHLERHGVFGHQRAGTDGAPILPLVSGNNHDSIHCRPDATTGVDADGAYRSGWHGLRDSRGSHKCRGAIFWRLHGGSRNIPCYCKHSAVGAEQPGQRHAAGGRYCAAQRRWTMRAAAWDEAVPGRRGPFLCQRTGRVRSIHVLHYAAGGGAENTACMGEQEAGQGVWDVGSAEAGQDGRVERGRSGSRELWTHVPIRLVGRCVKYLPVEQIVWKGRVPRYLTR